MVVLILVFWCWCLFYGGFGIGGCGIAGDGGGSSVGGLTVGRVVFVTVVVVLNIYSSIFQYEI